jgi:hypothetical protein
MPDSSGQRQEGGGKEGGDDPLERGHVEDLDQIGLETLRRWGINHRTDSHSRGKPTRRSIRRAGYQVRRVVTITVATKSSSTIDTGAQMARSAVLLVMILRTTATAA